MILSQNDVDEAIVKMAPEALETILSNLFDNSRQHGAGQVTITLNKNGTIEETNGFLEITL